MNGKVIEERSMLYTSYKDYIKIPFLFQGQYYDEEIKLAYNRFRYYDPELGRYISEDPIRFASGATALHSYVEDSNTWTDTFGLRAGNTSFLPSELHPGTISAKKIQEEYIEFLQVEIIMMIKLRCTQKQGYQNLLVQITLHIILLRS